MKKAIVLLIIATVFYSCDTIKNKTSHAKTEDRQSESSSEKITYRKGDTVSYIIPNVKLKDTTIYTVNREGTTLRTIYDQQGGVKQVDCMTSQIMDILRENQKLNEKIAEQERTKDKKTEFNTDWILYIVVAVFLLILIVIIIALRYLKGYINKIVPN